MNTTILLRCSLVYLFFQFSIGIICAQNQMTLEDIIPDHSITKFPQGLLYTENSALILLEETTKTTLAQGKTPDKAQLVLENRYLNIYEDYVSTISTSNDYVLFNAVVSPFHGKAAFIERIPYQPTWNLKVYNPVTKNYKIILTEQNNPLGMLMPRPIGWTKHGQLLVDGFHIDIGIENQGLWLLDPTTAQFTSIQPAGNYIGTPLVTPDGNSFLYTASSAKERDILHGSIDEVWIKSFTTVHEAKVLSGAKFNLIGWTEEKASTLKLNNPNPYGPNKGSISVKMPFNYGQLAYITRHGNEPPAAHGNTPGNGISCYNYGTPIHDNKIAIDWSNVSGTCNTNGGTANDQIDILASSTGKVVFSAYGSNSNGANGYGELIKIRADSDSSIAYYAHLSQRLVVVGQKVAQGTIIGKEGNTGNSTGEHLHQEFRAWNDEASTRHYKEFSDCGQAIPTFGYMYSSANIVIPIFVCKACRVDLTPNCVSAGTSALSSNITIYNVNVSNLSDTVSGSFKANYYLLGSSNSYFLGVQPSPGINAYSTIQLPAINFLLNNIPSGTYTLKVAIETDEADEDYDLTNNTCTVSTPVVIPGSSSCPGSLSLTGTISNNQTYQATNNINSTQKLTTNADVEYVAGNLIVMNPGFIAHQGSDFHSYIGSCSNKTDHQNPTEENNLSTGLKMTTNSDLTDTGSSTNLVATPNPFQTTTTLSFLLESNTTIDLAVYDLNGKKIKQLANGFLEEGSHNYTWQVKDIPVGIYFARLIYGTEMQTIKVILAK